MRYVHLPTSEFRKQITACPVVSELSKRGSATVQFPIQFVADDASVVELQVGGGEVVTIGFKAPAGYNSVAFILGPFSAAKSGTGTSTVYTFPIVFLSALLDQLLAGNLDEVDLVAEIKWTSTLYNGETLEFTWTVQNNVNRGGESVPSYPVTSVTVRSPARLTANRRRARHRSRCSALGRLRQWFRVRSRHRRCDARRPCRLPLGKRQHPRRDRHQRNRRRDPLHRRDEVVPDLSQAFTQGRKDAKVGSNSGILLRLGDFA
jgi:hypothetical protein